MTPLKVGQKITRMIPIVTDNRDVARERDKYAVTITIGGIEFRPKGCGEAKAVFVAWPTVLSLALRAAAHQK